MQMSTKPIETIPMTVRYHLPDGNINEVERHVWKTSRNNWAWTEPAPSLKTELRFVIGSRNNKAVMYWNDHWHVVGSFDQHVVDIDGATVQSVLGK